MTRDELEHLETQVKTIGEAAKLHKLYVLQDEAIENRLYSLALAYQNRIDELTKETK